MKKIDFSSCHNEQDVIDLINDCYVNTPLFTFTSNSEDNHRILSDYFHMICNITMDDDLPADIKSRDIDSYRIYLDDVIIDLFFQEHYLYSGSDDYCYSYRLVKL